MKGYNVRRQSLSPEITNQERTDTSLNQTGTTRFPDKTNKALKPEINIYVKSRSGADSRWYQTNSSKKACLKRTITAEKFKEYHETNIVEKQVKNNSNCKCFDIPPSKTPCNIQTHSL